MNGHRAATRSRFAIFAFLATLAAGLVAPMSPAQAAGPCDPGGNAIICENSLPGSPPSEWNTNPRGTVEGYGDQMSVNVGDPIGFKVRSAATALTLDIYRMGYYQQGTGARKITSLSPDTSVAQNQPSCPNNTTTGTVSCSWGTVASWTVPTTAVSGIYFAHVVRPDTGDDAHIMFVVRDDARHSDVLFKTSDTTWQAYNTWGDIPATTDNPNKVLNSFYHGDSTVAPGRAVKLSYNRPFNSRESTPWGRDFVFANEYPMVRWLEANGYDVAYEASHDVDRSPALLLNHKAVLSVGHDEYWSGEERAAFENARDNGVNLAFFSGNEVYWKTRWEDGYRTLVTYKETQANAKIDPAANVWTGTWRDPRFSPPADGGRPENALTGTLFTVNCTTTDNGCNAIDMKVPDQDGKMRFWRDTSVANLSAGQTATLPGILGYEWDEDVDNGYRPAGLVPLSSTTATAEQKMMDFGTKVGVASATHRLTMYRAASGARVFGAGTVQWSWGLSDTHDGISGAVDTRVKQATVNLFADMGVQPKSLESGLVAATASTDTTAPTAAFTSPEVNTSIANGSSVTITGTASDTGGQVGAVEVSTDGGTTWHPATGRGAWSYTWNATGAGTVTLKVRATDDSGNIGTPVTRDVVVTCPCGLFADGATPATAAVNDSTALELGVRFRSTVPGYVTGVDFYKGTGNTGTHTGTLWTSTGTQLATGTFADETATGWQRLTFTSPVYISANTDYIASYYAPNGHYATDANWYRYASTVTPPLTAPQTSGTTANGVYRSSAGFPNQTYNGGNYWVDVVFAINDTFPPAVTSASPYSGSSSVATGTQPSVTFGEPIKTDTATFTLKNAANDPVAGSATLDSTRTVLTFTPSAALTASTTYTAQVSGAADDAGNIMTAPFSFTFTTSKAYTAGVCPCTVWPDSSSLPAQQAVTDSASVELGMKFQSDVDGYLEGIRFYKGQSNTGTHTATLWTSTGTQLATATFTGESSAGWQEVLFPTHVAVTKNTTYVASYHAPNGHYASTPSGLSSAVTASPLKALGSGQDGPNGVYRYGSSTVFPNQTWNSTNYWVDPILIRASDNTPPTVTSVSPGSGATSVPAGAKVLVNFSEPVQTGTSVITLKDAANVTITGTTQLNPARTQAIFIPSASMAASSTYSFTVSGAKDDAGNPLTAAGPWTFTTSGTAACPCSIWASDATPTKASENDSSSVNVGVRFTSDVAGTITGIRFYKGAGNTGTHVGSLWTSTGTLLASGSFIGETASGWQMLTFATPVTISANTTYVASYLAPSGHYAGDSGYFTSGPYVNSPLRTASGSNGVYKYSSSSAFPNTTYNGGNYWVDVLFTP
ncbi:MAG: hypothetical protein JWQ95_5973 [Sphaerisporangium sp.]|nr:hypothetical protein [Sphaerisporangium sp.]